MPIAKKLAGVVPYRWIMAVASLQYRFRWPWLKALFEAVARRFRNRDMTMTRGLGKGLRFNSGGSIAGYAVGYPEPELQQALGLALEPGMTFYDLGANVGFLSVIAARLVGRDGRVVSFEPVPANAEQIRHNARLNHFDHLRVRQAAVAGSDGEATFRVADFATTGRLEAAGEIHNQVGELSVPICRLDTVSADPELGPPDVLKIDAEGAEVEILQGARRLLSEQRPIFFVETHGTNAALQEIFTAHRYRTVVLGKKVAVTETHWNDRIAGVPQEHAGCEELCRRLTEVGQEV